MRRNTYIRDREIQVPIGWSVAMTPKQHTRIFNGGNMIWKDPIVDEVRQARKRRAKRFNNDIRAIAADAQEHQIKNKKRLVSFAGPKNKAS